MDDFSRALAAAAVIDGQRFTLPGCGTLAGTYVPARVDHLARTVQPPTLDVAWSPDPVAGAQTFADLLAVSGATSAEASATQDSWVEALHAGETIAVGDLGDLRLERDSGRIGFAANEAGLLGAFWSGGPVAVEPLARRPTPTKIEFAPLSTTRPAPPPRRRARRASSAPSRAVPIVGGVVALALVIFGYVTLAGDGEAAATVPEADDNRGQVVAVRNERLNRSPREASAEAPAPAPAPAAAAPAEQDLAVPAGESTAKAGAPERATPASPAPAMASPAARAAPPSGPATAVSPEPPAAEPAPEVPASFDPATLAGQPADFDPDAVQAVIVLGSFGNADNAARLTERLAGDGLVPYVGQRGKLTQVGVTVSASSDNEVATILQQLRGDYNPEAYVINPE